MKFYFLSAALLLIQTLTYSQYWEKVDSVFSSSGVVPTSFSAPAFGDLNNDGHPDLMLGNLSDQVEYFQNNGNPPVPTFHKDASVTDPIYSGGLQGTNSDYPVLIDFDYDGDLDLLIGGYYGILYYDNIGTQNLPVWEKIDTVFSDINTEIGTDAKPAFADLDNDGDLDLFVGIGESLFGGPEPGTMRGYRNTGSPRDPVFELDNSLTTGIPDVGLNSYPAFADLDNDGDADLLIGRDSRTFFYFTNTGNAQSPAWTNNSGLFGGIENQNYWKDPSFADIDEDGDLDLIYGTDTGTLYVYLNNGTITSPQFVYNSNYFSVVKLSESASTVSFADLDNDGDQDLLSGNWLGKMEYFENQGDAGTPKFVKVNSQPTNLTTGSIYSTPAFTDVDGDNDFDIVSGSLNGGLVYFVNNNGIFTNNTTLFAGINVGGFSSPAFADMDGDGDLDLLVGAESSGASKFYLNDNGTFNLDNTIFSGVSFPSRIRPALADIDADGDFDLIIGRVSGSIDYYENTGTSTAPAWTKDTQIFSGIEVKQSAHPGFADLDGDTKLDMVIGEYDGNFTFYKNLFAVTGVKDLSIVLNTFELFENYPNPFNPGTKLRFSLSGLSNVQIEVFDITGRKVAEIINDQLNSGIHEIYFDASKFSLSSGTYIFRIKSVNLVDGKIASSILKGILLK